VDVKVKEACDLSVRIPEWVRPGEVRVQVGGAERQVDFAGRYAQVGAVKPGEVVATTFPIVERTDTVWIEKDRYALVRKGHEIVAIDPPGRYVPLFQRDHYRADRARWHKIERFVADDPLVW
jgi:hypothetical protein